MDILINKINNFLPQIHGTYFSWSLFLVICLVMGVLVRKKINISLNQVVGKIQKSILILVISILLILISGLSYLYFIPMFLISAVIFLIFIPIFLILVPKLLVKIPIYLAALEKVRLESTKYLDAAVPEIVSDWNSQELIKRASSNFLETVDKQELQKAFFICANDLGKLTCYQLSKECLKGWKVKGSSSKLISFWKFFITNNKQEAEPAKLWKSILINYENVAIFEKETANIEIQIVKEQDQYFINSMKINIDSELNQRCFILGKAAKLDD